MNLKMKALTVAVAAGLSMSAAQAADVAMFPYVVNSPSVTTLVSIIDQGGADTPRYDASGNPGIAANNNRLHWRLNYKAGADATNNAARCQEVNYYLPTSPNDMQTVDIGGRFGAATRGVLFNDPSSNNNWQAATSATINYMLGAAAGNVQRGVLFVHNADDDSGAVTGQTIYGEAMILEFATGSAWGYQAILTDNGVVNDANAFDYTALASNAGGAPDLLTFMPLNEVVTRVFVTPVPSAPILEVNGSNAPGWDRWNAGVTLQTNTGVAYDRDENLVSGSNRVQVACVGAVDAQQMMTGGAAAVLANGGYGLLNVANGTLDPFGIAFVPTNRAFLTKLEYNTTGMLNGQSATGIAGGTFNNGFIMR